MLRPRPVASTAARCLVGGGPSPVVAVAPSPEVATPGPEVATAGPEVATAGPEAAAPGLEVAPGPISVVVSGATGAGYPVTPVAMPGVGAAAVLISNPAVTTGPGLSGWPPGAAATAARFRHGVAVGQQTASEAMEHSGERRPRLGAIGATQVLRAGAAVRMTGLISQPRAARSSLENPPTAHGSHPAAKARRGSPTAPEPAMQASRDAGKRDTSQVSAGRCIRPQRLHRPSWRDHQVDPG